MDLGLNEKTFRAIKGLMREYGLNTIDYEFDTGRVRILDLGVDTEPSEEDAWDIGERVAEASMGCLGGVRIKRNNIHVRIDEYPSIATLSCQMAGWAVKYDNICALGSGPARILARKPSDMIDNVGYHEDSEEGVLVLETGRIPMKVSCKEILDKSNTRELMLITFKGDSIIGLINIMARIVEVGIYRLERLGYNVNRILSAKGSVPVPELNNEVVFTSNDAIIYSGEVSLRVKGWDPELTERAVSRASKFYGRDFKEIFDEAGRDFYKIDPDIFAPARLKVMDLENNKEYVAGELR